MANFSDKTMAQLEDITASAEYEIRLRAKGQQKPIYVVSTGDSASCFKSREEAKACVAENVFDHQDDPGGWKERLDCYVRWMPELDYEKAADSWLEI